MKINEVESPSFVASAARSPMESFIFQQRDLLNHLPNIAIFLDLNFRVQYTNSTFRKYFSTDHEALSGTSFFDFCKIGDQEEVRKVLESALTGNIGSYHGMFSLENSPTQKTNLKIIPAYTEQQEIIGIYCICQNVAAVASGLEWIPENAISYEAIFNTTSQFIGQLDLAGNLIKANQNALDFGGLQLEDVLYKPFWECYWWSLSEQTKTALQSNIKKAAKGEFVRYFVEVKGKDQNAVIDFSLKPGKVDNKIQFIIAEGKIINEAYATKFALLQSEQRFKFLIESMSDLVCLHAPDGTYTYVSPSVQKILGFSPEELIGTSPYQLFHHDDLELIAKTHQGAIENINKYKVEYRMRCKDQSFIWLETMTQVIRNAEGNVEYIITNSRNINERKQVYQALQESEMRFRNFFEQSLLGIAIHDPNGKVISANPALLNMLGYKVHELINRNLVEFHDPTELPKIQETLKELTASGNAQIETRMVRKDGSLFDVGVFTKAYQASGHTLFQVMVLDISDRQKARQQLENYSKELADQVHIRTQELQVAIEDLEWFAHAISHDLKTPLRHLIGFSQLLQRSIKDPSPSSLGYIQEIQGAAKKMSDLIEAVLHFSKLGNQPIAKTSFPLNEIIQEVIKQHGPETTNRIQWTIEPLGEINADRALLQQVLENLISNAIKFSSKENTPTIELRNWQDDQGHRGFLIKDNGVGFDDNNQEKLFGVFQRLHSLKEFNGTGIGLANVKKIIDRHGWSIEGVSQPGEGAMFIVKFHEA